MVAVRIHSLRGHRTAVAKRGVPTRAGRGEWAPNQRGYANAHPTNDGPKSDAPTAAGEQGECTKRPGCPNTDPSAREQAPQLPIWAVG